MKKLLQLKTMLLLCALIVGSGSVWAENVVFDFQQNTDAYGWDKTPANSTDFEVNDVLTNGDVTFTYTAKGSGNTHLRWWSTGDGLRSYKGNKFKIATADGEITSITIEGTCVLQESTSTGGTISNSRNWAAPAAGGVQEVEFLCNQSSGQKTIKKITVSIKSSDPSSEITFENKTPTIDFPENKSYSQVPSTASGYMSTDGASISYLITENTAGATINSTTGYVTVSQPGSVTVKATAASISGKFASSEDTYTLTVNDTRADSEIEWSDYAEVRIAKDAEDYSLPTLMNPNSLVVSYEISGTEGLASEVDGVISVNTSIEGSATITAIFEGNEDFKPASVSYIIVVYDANVKGSKYNPYTVADVIELNPTSTSTAVASNVYVKGFIIGAVDSSSGALKNISQSNDIDTNLAIADDPSETEDYCTVQLPSGDIRNALKTKGQTHNIRFAQVLVKGNIKKYCSKPGVRDVSEGSKIAEQVEITSAGMATYYTDCALDFSGYDDMYAYVANVDGSVVNFARVKKVPANTAVLLRNPSGSSASHVVPVVASGESVTSDLTGTLVAIDGLATASTNYILNTGEYGVGFYYANGLPVGVHKAYLTVSSGASRAFIGFEEEETNVEELKSSNFVEKASVYNLAGQRVYQPTKGLYIINGNKVLVK